MTEAWMTALMGHAVPGAQLLSAEPLSGGYANDLWRVHLSGSEPVSVVVRAWRRNPAGAAIELAVMERAARMVPVPEVLAQDLTGERPAVVLTDMPGLPGDVALERHPDQAEQIGRALGEAFGRLSGIRFDSGGFFADPSLTVAGFGGSAAEQLLAFAQPRVGSDTVRDVLGAEGQAKWWALIEAAAPALTGLEAERSLVHADANPKNVLVERGETGWTVTALLDWEFAFSGPSLMDLGNLLRFESRDGTPFAAGVLAGWRGGGGPTPPGFVEMARTLEVYSLEAFVNAPQSALHGPVVDLVRRQLAEGRL